MTHEEINGTLSEAERESPAYRKLSDSAYLPYRKPVPIVPGEVHKHWSGKWQFITESKGLL